MKKNTDAPKLHSILFAAFASLSLVSCATPEVKREPVSPPVDDAFAVKGHIEKKPTLPEAGEDSSEIPSLVTKRALMPPKPDFQKMVQKYSVSAVDVPAKELLFKLAQDANKELDLHSGVEGTITINAINRDLDTLLNRIAMQLGAVYEVTRDVITFRPDTPYWNNYSIDYVNIKKTSKGTIDMKMSVGGSSGIGEDNSSDTGGSASKIEVFSEHDFWGEIEENLSRLVQSGMKEGQAATKNSKNQSVVVNEETGVISVFATGSEHRAIKIYLNQNMDRADRQVLIEATVVEVNLSDQYQAGIDWSTLMKSGKASGTASQSLIPVDFPNSEMTGIGSTFTIGDVDWDFSLKMLQQFGDTKVLSSPKIMAVNNQTALLKVVDNEVYFTIEVDREAATTTSPGVTTYETEVHTVPVGFMMNVTPFVSDDDRVSLDIRPTISRVVGYRNDPSPDLAAENITSRIPVIQEREMASVLKLRNRQTAIIGGLIEDSNQNDKNSVPWVGDIPVVGDLFSYKDDVAQKSELVIFIRPIVVKNPDVDNGDLTSLKKFLKTDKN